MHDKIQSLDKKNKLLEDNLEGANSQIESLSNQVKIL
jgi:hypothetical protein